MDTNQLIRLATIAVNKRIIYDPAFEHKDLIQIAIVAILQKPNAHPGRQIMHARSVIRNVRESNQCKRRREQKSTYEGYDKQVASNNCNHIEEIMVKEIRSMLLSGINLTIKQQQLISDISLGFTPVQIAKKRNFSPASVRRWIKEIANKYKD